MRKRIILITLGIVVVLIICTLFAAEYYTSRPSFCGSCHIMKRYYESWMKDKKHSEKGVICIDCHYAPGEHRTLKAKFKGLGQLFSYVSKFVEETEVRTTTKISDLSCLASECHPKDKYADKKISYTEKSFYIHKTHEEKKIEGQELHCDTCHIHLKAEKHFEVPKETCFICHFKNTAFNEGRGKCALCHTIPEKPVQKKRKEGEATEQPVTHKYIEEAKIPCSSCHYELVQGYGEIKEEDCLHCHEADEALKQLEATDRMQIMHKAHVSGQNAHCFDCHMTIKHKEVKRLAATVQNCKACHPEPHIYQQLLIEGIGGKGIEEQYPIAHFDVRVNCFACHMVNGVDAKGRKVKRASPKACVECHMRDEQKEGLGKKWQSDVAEYLAEARNLEKKAFDEIELAKGNIPDKIIRKAKALVKDGHDNLRLVDAGGGVHNKKYAMLLIDAAIKNFENAIEEVK